MQAARMLVVVGCFYIGLIASVERADAQNWPQWRGPFGDGHSTDKSLPASWLAKQVEWRTPLPGFGQSSPIVWGELIFLTSASETGDQRYVLCLDRASGKIRWAKTAWQGEAEKTHAMNNRASATCATDGERVIAFFGKGGIHCYDFHGEKLWSKDLGTFAGPWGTAASPIIVGDVVVQNCDADEKARIVGLDKKTGEILWSTPREPLRGWSTPVLIEANGRQEIVLNGEKTIVSYDPQTGKPLWSARGSRGRGTPTIAPAQGLLVAVCGRPGEMVALRPGGQGDVSDSHEVWRVARKGGRDLPSPIVVGDYLVVFKLRPGLVSCYQVRTGEELWTERLDGAFSSSPIAANGLVYAVNEEGTTFVIRPGAKFERVAANKLDSQGNEVFRASVTPHQGQLLIRSDQALYCVGDRATR